MTAFSQTSGIHHHTRTGRRAARTLWGSIGTGIVLAAITLTATSLGTHARVAPQPNEMWSVVAAPPASVFDEISQAWVPLPVRE